MSDSRGQEIAKSGEEEGILFIRKCEFLFEIGNSSNYRFHDRKLGAKIDMKAPTVIRRAYLIIFIIISCLVGIYASSAQ